MRKEQILGRIPCPNLFAAALGVALAFAPIPAKAQLLLNGGFESPVLADGDPGVFHTGESGQSLGLELGSASLPGWQVGTNVTLVLNRGSAYGAGPVDGYQYLAFDPGNRPPGGTLLQPFATTPGQQYALQFSVGDGGAGLDLLLDVTIVTAGDLSNPLAHQQISPPQTAGFAPPLSMIFTAENPLTEVVFTDTSSPSVTPYEDLLLDGVSVYIVPEPTTATLLILCSSLALARNRYANSRLDHPN